MSYITKKDFSRELEIRLRDKLTATQIDSVLCELTEQMADYDVERTETQKGEKDFDDILRLFAEAKRVEGRSEKTIQRYLYIISLLRRQDSTPIDKLSVYNLRQFLAKEKARGISDTTLKADREVLSAFFGWVTREGILQHNPMANLNPIKYKREIKLPYSDVDLEKLKDACDNDRDKAMVAFLGSTGCRIGEVCRLNRDDIDFRNLECTVLGKGNKERTVYIDPVCALQLMKYFQSRKDDSPALFAGRNTERMTPHGIRERLNKIASIAQVEHVHPHRFRRTLATKLLTHGMPIQEVKTLLGHEKLDTTMTYVYIDQRNVQNSYRRYI